MDKILSLPSNLVEGFNALTGLAREEYFPVCDPEGTKVGSGGGTAWAIAEHWKEFSATHKETSVSKPFQGYSIDNYLSSRKRVIVHAGGQSRRLPAYAPSGKILTPIPVFRWSHGQSLQQNLLSLQLPLYQAIMNRSNGFQNTLIASGDVIIYCTEMEKTIPEADVVCYGIWTEPQLATNHGVFFVNRSANDRLDFMLQKPSHTEIDALSVSHMFLMDTGLWLLSDKAVKVLMKKSGFDGIYFKNQKPDFYDLYSTFGASLGENPKVYDAEISSLSVAIVTIDKGEFFHFGTSPEMISSMVRIQNQVVDQRNIWQKNIKPHASIFVQNADCRYKLSDTHKNIWIENSTVAQEWSLTANHIITGVPANDWELGLADGQCLDIVPIDEGKYCVRTYNIKDKFRGEIGNDETMFLGIPFKEWLKNCGLTMEELALDAKTDIQSAKIFPVVEKVSEELVNFMLGNNTDKSDYLKCERLSADEISARANVKRLFDSRREYLKENAVSLARNYSKSVFYQVDLKELARFYYENDIPLPAELPSTESPLILMRDYMFRSEVERLRGVTDENDAKAFGVLHNMILSSFDEKVSPRCSVHPDQIVWARSPARLDIAGGWTDTPPNCLQNGGKVVNIAVELNGQPPIQVYVRLSQKPTIVLRSIDNGVSEEVTTFEQLGEYNKVGSAFSIPKAALCLVGFHPDFCKQRYDSLEAQLKAFGGGMEITLLVAIPKGSGLGTSSILASTIVGALADFCGLNWHRKKISHATLIIEQLLTTGGGWQDQYGGVFRGVKLLETQPGTQENITIKWLPNHIFTSQEFSARWLLYYTGITRVAKNILAEIVRGMFLNEKERYAILSEMKTHALDMAEAIQISDFQAVGRLIRHSWELNCALDSGTTTEEIESITDKIDKYSLGYKLLGAGGGGYMLICAKDTDSAGKIRQILQENPPNEKARFVEMTVSLTGLQISRS